MMALGLIETKGLIGAVEGADAMLKAADVHLLEKNLATGGLVTITIAGEVSAVRASVDAAVASIGRIEGATLVSEHVIARPDTELTKILALEPDEEAPAAEEPAPDVRDEPASQPEELALPEQEVSDLPAKRESARYDAAQLRSMSLNRLRQIARDVDGLAMAQEKIASADKKALIEAITNAYKQIKE